MARIDAPGAVRPAATPRASASARPFGELAATLAASAPVDADRVAQLRTAIAEGRYPIDAHAIADRMLSFARGGNADDAA